MEISRSSTRRRQATVFLIIFAGLGCQPVAEMAPPPDAITSKSGVKMISLPGGTFKMGTSKGETDEAPTHDVAISPFLIDKYEVTHELFVTAQLPNPSRWQDDPRKPVERVRWRDAKEYCNERSRLEGLTPCYDEEKVGRPCNFAVDGYRLPTEAEWEYACRAGKSGAYDFGEASQLAQHAVFAENGEQRTHVVGSKKPNGWGIHDMYGNVAEWCHDIYQSDYYAKSASRDPTGPAAESNDVKRVLRGGSWKATATMCRSTFRQGQRTGDTDACFYTDYCGFRCVRRP